MVADDAYPDVRIHRKSALQVGPANSRYRLWLTLGERIGGGRWQDSFDPRAVCLHLFDAHLTLRGFQCTALRGAARPEKLLIVLSGGAAGAPGLRPREVVVAGLTPSGIEAARVGAASKFVRAPVGDKAFLVVTRVKVEAVEFLRGGYVCAKVVVGACQDC